MVLLTQRPARAAGAPATVAPNPDRRPDGVGRLRALDAMRLGAALMVAAFHFLALDDRTSPWGRRSADVFVSIDALAPYGWLGVEVFFIISGFAICMSSWGRSVGRFARSRVVRLFPAYWVAVPLTFAVTSLFPEVWRVPTASEAIVNLTMLQDPLGVPKVDIVYWTLWAEMRFYLLFALFVWWGLTYKRVIGFCLAWTLLAAVADSSGSAVLDVVAMPSNASYFIVGVGLYLVHRFGHHLLTWLVIGVNAAISLRNAVARMEHQSVDIVHQPLHAWVVAGVLGLAVLLVLAIARGKLDWVRWRWVTSAGALTYPFYLLHAGIGFVLIHLLSTELGLAPVPTLALTLAATLGLAWVVHRLVERPLARVLGRQLDRLPPAEPADLRRSAP